MRIAILLLLLVFSPLFSFAQPSVLTEDAEISVLTVGSGKLLNDTFGHNGLRIKDMRRNIDVVFNYGVYDFNAPNFYLKFAQGKLNYMIGANRYSDFYDLYTYQNRSIKEQVLDLSYDEKQGLYNFLLNNYEPENRYYLYDFFYDNCATKMRDVVEATVDKVVFTVPEDLEKKTFRELIYEHVDRNSWGSFGIDLALGSVIDREASPDQYMFLPKYVFEFFEVAERSDGSSLVSESRDIYRPGPEKSSLEWIFSPLMVLSLLSLFIIYLTLKDWKKRRQRLWIDRSIFVFTGITGLVILLLWFATDHTATANNYNLLWAFPLNLLFISKIGKAKPGSWFRRYLKFLMIMLLLMVFHWFTGVQVFAVGLIPLLIMIAFRYLFMIQILKPEPTITSE